MTGDFPASCVVNGLRHLGGDRFCAQEVGNLLLRTTDGLSELGLRSKYADCIFDVGSDLHTSFLVDYSTPCNKETCRATHKAAGIIARAMTIANNLKQFRKEAGLSQKQLAQDSGVSQQLISQIEGGDNNSTKHLAALARVLGKKLTDFDPTLGDVVTDDPFPERYLKLDEADKIVVQALIERLERGRAE